MPASALALQSRFRTRQESLPSAEKPPLALLDSVAMRIGCRRGQVIPQAGWPTERWYRVLAGAAEKCSILPDGRRQIVDLALPGDFFAFSARTDGQHFIEAIVDDTLIACYPRARVEMIADANPEVARALHEVALKAAARAERQILILGQMTAAEKVVAFLLSMVERLSGDGKDEVTLPVSRYEIADYLAISAETVSRSLTELRHRGAISIEGTRKIRILDRGSF
jgi:CRP/FNR family transcriptional regulator, nitrogen fixation regulation protein